MDAPASRLHVPRKNCLEKMKSPAIIMNPKIATSRVSLLLLLFVFCAVTALAQTTVFTYQGQLKEGSMPANGIYNMQFRLFDQADVGAGAQVGPTFTPPPVQVTNGAFTVPLDFGAGAFPGGARYLEIVINGTLLKPRQQITSTPYAIRSLASTSADTATNATQLGGVTANQFVQTGDARLSDPRPPTAGSSNYIQSNPAGQQAGASFNIIGDGKAGGTLSGDVVNAVTQYTIGGNRVLSVGGGNSGSLSLGAGSGNPNSAAFGTYLGQSAGAQNTGLGKTFVGSKIGRADTTGGTNSFFGAAAGFKNAASSNSFFGAYSGQENTTGYDNAFFGAGAGNANQTGAQNSFFGKSAGLRTTTGGDNNFFGINAGINNTTGSFNTFLGSAA